MCDVIHVDTVKEKLEKQVKRIEELETKVNIMEVLAEERRQFIVNGVELDYITLPDCEVASANDTFARCNLENEYAFNNFKLEQQAKGIESVVAEMGITPRSNSIHYELVADMARQLREQAKQLKEHKDDER
jgi:hypothetical protein